MRVRTGVLDVVRRLLRAGEDRGCARDAQRFPGQEVRSACILAFQSGWTGSQRRCLVCALVLKWTECEKLVSQIRGLTWIPRLKILLVIMGAGGLKLCSVPASPFSSDSHYYDGKMRGI